MEIHGHFHPHFQQKWVVREYHSCAFEYYLSPYKVNIFKGAKWINLPYIWHQMQGSYVGQLDLLPFINYWAIPEDQIETIAKPLHQIIEWISLKILIRSA